MWQLSRKADTAVDKLKCYVSNSTLVEEKRRFFKRYYKGDRVRLRGSAYRGKGTVKRAAVADEGGLMIAWDDKPGELHMHNPRYIETVWLNEEGQEL